MVPRAPVRMRTGKQSYRPQIGARCWPLLAGVWRAIAPLMKPWCAEEEVPTAANLNFYRRRDSCDRWHCDDEPLFGRGRGGGTSKLIVSVRTVKLARAFLVMGDILVMDGQSRDEFLHCTDQVWNRSGLTLHSVGLSGTAASCALRTKAVCYLQTCAQGSSAAVTGGVGGGTYWALWVLLGVLCIMGGGGEGGRRGLALLVFPSYLQDSGYGGVPIAGHAHWAEVGGGIICATLGEFTGLHKRVLGFFQVGGSDPICGMPYMLALGGTAQCPWLSCMYGMLCVGILS